MLRIRRAKAPSRLTAARRSILPTALFILLTAAWPDVSWPAALSSSNNWTGVSCFLRALRGGFFFRGADDFGLAAAFFFFFAPALQITNYGFIITRTGDLQITASLYIRLQITASLYIHKSGWQNYPFTNYGFVIYTQVRMTKLLVYKLRLHYNTKTSGWQ